MKTFYLAGDMLKKGNILLRQEEAKQLRKLGFNVYSAVEQKDINDKTNMTVEENNTLAERIYKKDVEHIRKSKYIIADIDNDSVGTSCEVSAIAEMNYWIDLIGEVIDSHYNYESLLKGLNDILNTHPRKKVYCHTSDIRHTDLPEIGTRRSFSINQYLHGCALEASDGRNITTFEDIMKEIKEEI